MLEELDLSDNRVGGEGLRALALALRSERARLATLSAQNNSVTEVGVVALLATVTSLELSQSSRDSLYLRGSAR